MFLYFYPGGDLVWKSLHLIIPTQWNFNNESSLNKLILFHNVVPQVLVHSGPKLKSVPLAELQ
jgi:hypothetical protein